MTRAQATKGRSKGKQGSVRGGSSAKENSREGVERAGGGGLVGQTERKFDGSHVNELQWHMKQLHRKSTCNSGMRTHTHTHTTVTHTDAQLSPSTPGHTQ